MQPCRYMKPITINSEHAERQITCTGELCQHATDDDMHGFCLLSVQTQPGSSRRMSQHTLFIRRPCMQTRRLFALTKAAMNRAGWQRHSPPSLVEMSASSRQVGHYWHHQHCSSRHTGNTYLWTTHGPAAHAVELRSTGRTRAGRIV